MSHIPPISQSRISRYVGWVSYDKGRKYQSTGRVRAPTRSQMSLQANVKGTSAVPYQVEIWFDEWDVRDASCSCPVGFEGQCKHVAAVLVHYSVYPETFVDAAPTPTADHGLRPGMPRAELQAWALAREATHLLDQAVGRLPLPRDHRNWLWWNGRDATVADVISADPQGKDKARMPAGFQEELLSWLDSAVLEQQRALYYERGAVWRQETPDPSLAAVLDGLRAVRPRLRALASPVQRGLGRPYWCRLHADPPHLDIDLHTDRVQIDLQPGPRGPLVLPHDLDAGQAAVYLHAVDVALDRLTHPEVAPAQRAEALDAVRVQPWERVLAAFDHHTVPVSEAEQEEEPRELGWKVQIKHGSLEIHPVLLRSYKSGKSGFRTWKHSIRATDELPLPADRKAAEWLAAPKGYGLAQQLRAIQILEALTGHPRVILGKGQHVSVRQDTVALDWRELSDGTIQISPLLAGASIGDGAVEDLLTSWAGGRAIHVDEEAAAIRVVALPQAAKGVLEALLLRGASFPPAAKGALLSRVTAIERHLPVRLVGTLRGTEVAGDRRFVFRVDPAPDGGLEAGAFVRPLAEGPTHRPGDGPVDVSAIRDGSRVVAPRDLADETHRLTALIGELGLPAEDAPQWTVLDPEAGLDLVVALRERPERVQCEWSRPRPVISRAATADDLRISGRMRHDWLGIDGNVQVDDLTLPLAEVLQAIAAKRRYIPMGDNGWLRLSAKLRQQLAALQGITRERGGELQLPTLGSATVASLEQDGAELDVPESWRTQVDAIRRAETLHPRIPEALHAQLRDYQAEGFRWLARLSSWAPGGCLADDMGLGKTLQALTLILHRDAGPTLVVAPASVGLNWERETERFAPTLRPQQYRGRDRASLLENLQTNDLLITSYELMTRDVETLAAIPFGTVVLDEAQAIKNASTRRSRAAARLDAGFVLSLTGTPVENHVGEVWSQFRTLAPGLLGSKDAFRIRFAVPIERDQNAEVRAALGDLIRPFILRRLKSEVARELPPRTEIVTRIQLSPPERQLYEGVRRAAVAALQEKDAGRMAILAVLTRLRQLACHPRLVHDDGPVQQSAKLTRLVEIATDLRDAGHRTLIFSQFTTYLGLIRDALEAQGLDCRYLDGSMPPQSRQREVDAFQDGRGDAFLISLKAGGTGLNLTAATYVIHADPWWNPAAEDQATDRAHRIGQTQPVTVYRLVAENTIEETVLALHEQKRNLMTELLQGTSGTAALRTDELLALLAAAG